MTFILVVCNPPQPTFCLLKLCFTFLKKKTKKQTKTTTTGSGYWLFLHNFSVAGPSHEAPPEQRHVRGGSSC